MAEPAAAGLRRLVAVGHKAYLGYAQTLAWLAAAVDPARQHADRVETVVFPVAPALPAAVEIGRGAFEVGAQDVSNRSPGAFTGELPAALLSEIGIGYVEVGHAERRYLFGETPRRIEQKLSMALEHGLLPLLCVGEGRIGDTSPVAAEPAVDETRAQLVSALQQLPGALPFVVAYEPVWAIGADRPAPVEHVRAVAEALRELLSPFSSARLLYGGTAGPGLFAELSDTTDGLFLGRRAHDPAGLAAVLAEVADCPPGAGR